MFSLISKNSFAFYKNLCITNKKTIPYYLLNNTINNNINNKKELLNTEEHVFKFNENVSELEYFEQLYKYLETSDTKKFNSNLNKK
jgi:histidyl-tRNA synthetase